MNTENIKPLEKNKLEHAAPKAESFCCGVTEEANACCSSNSEVNTSIEASASSCCTPETKGTVGCC